MRKLRFLVSDLGYVWTNLKICLRRSLVSRTLDPIPFNDLT